jgi:hypothetical protein
LAVALTGDGPLTGVETADSFDNRLTNWKSAGDQNPDGDDRTARPAAGTNFGFNVVSTKGLRKTHYTLRIPLTVS